ncbi:hypothetical protein L204_104445 [Cryptococcus depauperatus]
MLSLSEEEKEEGHELVFYGRSSSTDATRSSRPLLSQDHSPPLSSSHWQGRYRAATPLAYSVGRSGRVRIWRIVAFMALPPLLLFLYSLIHPHVNGLPPLPKISITSGEVISELFYEENIIQDCICGENDEGRRLCSLYHKEGLRNSRLIQGTGARGFWAVASRHVMVSTQVQTFPKVTREVQDVIRPSLWIGSGKHFQRPIIVLGMVP